MKIVYKSKIEKIGERQGFRVKKKIVKRDFSGNHHLSNSNIFGLWLNREYRQRIGNYTEYLYLDTLPGCVSVARDGFLSTVTVTLS